MKDVEIDYDGKKIAVKVPSEDDLQREKEFHRKMMLLAGGSFDDAVDGE